MEKPYIFFDTAPAFWVFILAVAASAIVSGLVCLSFPEALVLRAIAVLVICASILWVPFWLDDRLRKKGKSSGN